MKKISKVSFILSIVLAAGAVALNIIGFCYINGVRIVRYGAYGYMQMYNYSTTSMANTCLGMIIAGGFMFIGAILLFMLSVMTKCRKDHCCKAKPEHCEAQSAPEPEKAPEQEAAPEAEAKAEEEPKAE